MRPKAVLFLAPVVWLLSSAAAARATSYDLSPPINNYYNIKAEYSEKLAYAGNRNLELRVTLTTPAAVPAAERITLAGVQSVDEPRIRITPLVRAGAAGDNVFRVEVPAGVEPRTYKLTLEFRDPQQTSILRYIDLNVGVRSQGKLRLVEAKTDPLILGAAREYALRFANDYPDYDVNVNRIIIRSLPSDLIESVRVAPGVGVEARVEHNVITFDPGVSIEASQQGTIPVVIGLRRTPSFINWVTGYGDDTKLAFDVRYDDGHERLISDFTPEVSVKVRPGDGFLFWTMVLGVLLGTGIKFYLEYLRRRGVVTKKGVAGFVVITVLVGIVITIVAWAGEIQIIAFKSVDLSYDKPSVIFIIGLIGALSGVHYLHRWSKKLTEEGR